MVKLKNIYIDDDSMTSLYIFNEFAIKCDFGHPNFNDYNETRFNSIVIFKYDKDELENTIETDGHKRYKDIEVSKSVIDTIIKDFYEFEVEKELDDNYIWDVTTFITPYIENIILSYEEYKIHDIKVNELFNKILLNMFNCHFKDRYYKNNKYPELKYEIID